MSEVTAQEARTMITLGGKTFEALTPTRIDAMVAGMTKKGKELRMEHAGKRIKGIKVIGDGQPFDGPIGRRYIYNVDLLSEVAFEGPKAQAAFETLVAAVESGNATAEEIHNCCREYMNAITVSFSIPSKKFQSGELVVASVEAITTKNGNLLTLNNVIAVEAEALKAEPAKKFSLAKLLGDRLATELVSTPAPVSMESINEKAVTE